MIIIDRIYQPDCTIGVLNYKNFRCFTLELPWRFNKPNRSCIPEGFYKVRKHDSPAHGKCIMVEGVTGRSWILIHVLNHVDQSEGCIGLGNAFVDFNNDGIPDVTNSGITLSRLMNIMPYSETLRIL